MPSVTVTPTPRSHNVTRTVLLDTAGERCLPIVSQVEKLLFYANQCSVYRTPCSEQCGRTDSFGQLSAPQCYFNNTENAYKCCHSACEGGCTGSLDTDCVACKYYKMNNSCVERCPPLKIRDTSLMVENPAGTYVDDRYCVKQCSSSNLSFCTTF